MLERLRSWPSRALTRRGIQVVPRISTSALTSSSRLRSHTARRPNPAGLLLAAPLLAGCLTLAWPSAKAAAASPAGATQWASGRILVMPRAGLAPRELARILGAHGGKARKVGQSDLHIVDLASRGSEKAIANLLARHPQLKFAEVDQRVAPHLAVNDPFAGSQWHLAKVGAPAAWDVSHGDGVTIAVLDSGVDESHPDLASRVVPGWNFYDNTADASDPHGHGTAVAGTAAAATDNSTGVASIAGQTKVMPIRIADANCWAYWSTVAEGLTWAADRGARVANISFGVAGSRSVQSAAKYMKAKGGLVVVSAGNNGVDEKITPTTTMIPVSATDAADVRTGWSSYGSFVALSAPGAGIYTTNRGGGYGSWNGTSFSSPLTAGVVALMMSANPALDNLQIESLLFGTAIDLGAAGRDAAYGHGRVNAAAAVQAARNAVPTADTTAPTSALTAPLASSTVSGVVAVDVAAGDNRGVARVELRVNGTTVAIDHEAPFGFSWDSTGVPNGMANLTAHAFDLAGNQGTSKTTAVNVANAITTVASDTTPPEVAIVNPAVGSVSGKVTVSASASDNAGAAGLVQSLYIDGVLKATGSGATLAYDWNTRHVAKGEHVLQVLARDAAGNSRSASVKVTR